MTELGECGGKRWDGLGLLRLLEWSCGCAWMDGWVSGGGVTQAKGGDAVVVGREVDLSPTLCAVDARFSRDQLS